MNKLVCAALVVASVALLAARGVLADDEPDLKKVLGEVDAQRYYPSEQGLETLKVVMIPPKNPMMPVELKVQFEWSAEAGSSIGLVDVPKQLEPMKPMIEMQLRSQLSGIEEQIAGVSLLKLIERMEASAAQDGEEVKVTLISKKKEDLEQKRTLWIKDGKVLRADRELLVPMMGKIVVKEEYEYVERDGRLLISKSVTSAQGKGGTETLEYEKLHGIWLIVGKSNDQGLNTRFVNHVVNGKATEEAKAEEEAKPEAKEEAKEKPTEEEDDF
ncbi:hypothetical protein ACFL59_00820 [Planctomycetota bacterium]